MNTISVGDKVQIKGTRGNATRGTVVQTANNGGRCLVDFPADPKSGATTDRTWIETDRLTKVG